jgi:hypothetical protein
MKASKKRATSNRKSRSDMDAVDDLLENSDFSNVTLKQAVALEDIQEARAGRGRPSVGKRRSIILPDELIERLKTLADKLNVGGYQPLIRLILSEKLSEYEKRAKKQ